MRCLLMLLLVAGLLPGAMVSATQMEAGVFSMATTTGRGFDTINFQQTYDQTPLVFTLMEYNGTQVAAYRMKNVTKTGFQATIAEPQGFDGPHASNPLRYIAITPGVYRLPDGTVLEAGAVDTTLIQRSTSQISGTVGRENISFQGGFSNTPTVLANIQTLNNETASLPNNPSRPWMTAGVDNVSASGVELFLERGNRDDGGVVSINETIAYLALEQGTGNFQDSNGKNILYEALVSAANLAAYTSGTQVPFQHSYSSAPLVVAAKNTRNQSHGWVRMGNNKISNTEVDLSIEGDRGNAGADAAGVAVFSESFVLNDLSQVNVTNNVAVPEPASLLLLGCALIGILVTRRR